MRRFLLALVAGLLLVGCGAFPVATGPDALSVPAAAAPAAQPLDSPARVEIPVLGVVDELVPVGLAPDRSMEVPAVDEVGWYEPGVRIGDIGPAVLAGHVNWDGTPGSFERLGELTPGDEIIVSDADGRQLTFEVYEKREFPKTEFDTAFVFGNRTSPELIAVTCSGPVRDHSYLHNTAVAARLVA